MTWLYLPSDALPEPETHASLACPSAACSPVAPASSEAQSPKKISTWGDGL